MDRREEGQMELFSSGGGIGANGAARQRDSSFYARVRVFEKTVLMLISIIITALVAFTAGIEKGKRNAVVRMNAENAAQKEMRVAAAFPQPAGGTALRPAQQSLAVPLAASSAVTMQAQEPAVREPQEQAAGTQRYTIQLASYKTRSAAEKEGARLKKLGFTVLIAAKGGYTILSIGNFSSREKAQSLLTEMKKRYTGCYVRKL